MKARWSFRKLLPLLTLVAALPVVALAWDEPTAAMKYEECMDRAEERFSECLDAADGTEFLCWSRFGYAKLACSIKYAIDSSRET